MKQNKMKCQKSRPVFDTPAVSFQLDCFSLNSVTVVLILEQIFHLFPFNLTEILCKIKCLDGFNSFTLNVSSFLFKKEKDSIPNRLL